MISNRIGFGAREPEREIRGSVRTVYPSHAIHPAICLNPCQANPQGLLQGLAPLRGSGQKPQRPLQISLASVQAPSIGSQKLYTDSVLGGAPAPTPTPPLYVSAGLRLFIYLLFHRIPVKKPTNREAGGRLKGGSGGGAGGRPPEHCMCIVSGFLCMFKRQYNENPTLRYLLDNLADVFLQDNENPTLRYLLEAAGLQIGWCESTLY